MPAPEDPATDAEPSSVASEQPQCRAGASGEQQEHLDATSLHQLVLETDTVQEFLDQLAIRAAADTGYSCGITVSPVDRTHTAYTIAASDEQTRRLDELQYADGAGPCLEALRDGVPIFVTDMAAETRWPGYVEHAQSVGARSSMAYPLQIDDSTIGALNFYAFGQGAPPTDVRARASELASITAGALALAQRLAQRQDMIENLRTALTSRSTIDQAIGVLMGQQRCTAEEAFDLLRKASQGRNIKLREVASGVVSSVQRGAQGNGRGRY